MQAGRSMWSTTLASVVTPVSRVVTVVESSRRPGPGRVQVAAALTGDTYACGTAKEGTSSWLCQTHHEEYEPSTGTNSWR